MSESTSSDGRRVSLRRRLAGPRSVSASDLRLLALAALLSSCTPSKHDTESIETIPPKPRADYDAPIGPMPEEVHEYHVGEIRRGDSLSTALARLGVGALEVDEVVQSLKGVFDFRHAQIGNLIEIRKDQAGALSWFRFTATVDTIAVAFRGSDGAMHGLLEPVHVVTRTTVAEGRVQYSLYEAMDAAGEQPGLTLTFVDLFAWDVDFFTETQTGDTFRIFVEKRFLDDKLIGYGRVLGAEYIMVGSKVHRAFLFEHSGHETGYYTEKGVSVRKAFLKSPIQFASITSRYGMRFHPILRFVRAHRGVDYGAPMGTAVWAVGDGVVRFAGKQGGYGNMVALKHANGLETHYAHLSGFAKGVRQGARVSQKQVIGYVGKTGLATGPHLHFEVLRQGRYANPLSVAVPPAPPISEAERESFSRAIAPALKALDDAGRAAFAQARVVKTSSISVE